MKKIEIKIKNKKIFLIITVVLLILLSFSSYIYFLNRDARKYEEYTEITFVTPTQAIVFWKTKEDTLGYVKYGQRKFRRKERENQTSSEEGKIHVVFLENIPLEGIFLTKHSENDNVLIFPKIEYIKYDGLDNGSE